MKALAALPPGVVVERAVVILVRRQTDVQEAICRATG